MFFTKYFTAFAFILISMVLAREAPAKKEPTLTVELLKTAMKACVLYNNKGIYLKCMREQHIKDDHVSEAAYIQRKDVDKLSDEILQEIIDTEAPPQKTEIGTVGYILMALAIMTFLAVAGVVVHVTTKKSSTDL